MRSLVGLEKICEVSRPPHTPRNYAALAFRSEGVVVIITVALDDEQSGAEVAIAYMTTLPFSFAGMGFGSRALKQFLAWAAHEGIKNIQAVQVQHQSESFWLKNGFVKIGNLTNDFSYLPS